MKFKLDENLPAELALDLLQLSHDADTVLGENLAGASDPAVLEAANAAGRILLTLDKGIANLQRYPVWQHSGVVLFRLTHWGGAPFSNLFGSVCRGFSNSI